MIRGFPVIPRIDSGTLFHGITVRNEFQVGLLTSGSSVLHAFPSYLSGINVNSVPGYSGGPVLELHEIPY